MRSIAWPQDTPATDAKSVIVSTMQERYIVGRDLQELISIVKSAETRSPAK